MPAELRHNHFSLPSRRQMLVVVSLSLFAACVPAAAAASAAAAVGTGAVRNAFLGLPLVSCRSCQVSATNLPAAVSAAPSAAGFCCWRPQCSVSIRLALSRRCSLFTCPAPSVVFERTALGLGESARGRRMAGALLRAVAVCLAVEATVHLVCVHRCA